MTENGSTLAKMVEGVRELGSHASSDDVLYGFMEYVSGLGLELYPAQEEAILELLSGNHVILCTPTGSGKSMVAMALHFLAACQERRSYYTAPTKALVNEKFFALCDAFGAKEVGLLTGDASVNRDAPIVCCTAEILSNMALRETELSIDSVVMDEFHYYGDKDRGAAWQVPLITMPSTQFLLMSATLGDTRAIASSLEGYTDRDVAAVTSTERPVPLEFVYRETPIHETIEHLLETGAAPIYLVNFTQRACAEQAQSLTSINVCTKQEKRLIAKELEGVELDTPYGKKFRRFVSHGIGIHHGGLLPKYRRVVERLSQTGLIKVISGTDTLGVGVNIPIRTVLFSQLYKYDGEKTAILPARDFHQVAGRAGRKGFDDEGLVVAQAPEWTIENRRNQAKIQKKPHLKKKLRRKGPPRGAVHWNEGHFRKLVESPPEPLDSQLEIDHGMLVNVLQSAPESRAGGYRRLMDIISRAHISSSEKSSQRRRAASLFRSLRQAGVVEVVRKDPQKPPRPRVQENLQENFSLYQALSLYLIETIDHLDPDNESFALDLLTLVESILEDPRVVLYRQVDKIKDELIARLKAEGVDYEDRIAELEKVEHPKPNADLIYMTFNEFADSHPWVGHENIRPKSVAREMFERCATFNDYVRDYGLGRSEGVLLRYLTQVYKTAVQNVPEPAWTEDFQDVLAYLHGLVRRTDDSLIREWRLLASNPEVSLTPASPSAAAETEARAEKKTPSAADLLEDPRAFRARVRNELHVLLKALADSQFEEACETIHHSEQHTWDPDALQEATAPCLEEYGELDVTPRARQSRNTIFIQEGDRTFTVQQKLIGPGDEDDWMLDCRVDLTDDRDPAKPLIELRRIGV